MTKLLCIYHKNCADGFGSAVAVNQWALSINRQCEFIPAHYGDIPPDVTNREVLIVDFSYPREILLEMQAKSSKITVIDHHKSAQKDLEGLDFCFFDMERSGAVSTWLSLFPYRAVPRLLEYIQDRDLWQWKLSGSKEVSAALQTIDQTFEAWDKYLLDDNIYKLIAQGHEILKYQQHCVKKIITSDGITMQNIAGYNVPCINTTHLISEIGNDLAKNQPFCALYFETGDKRIYSLRSAPNGIDVSDIAKLFGGGGHQHAAGFSIEKYNYDLSQGDPI